MTDNLTKQRRSEVMATISSKGNRATELRLVSIMRSNHITGWRRNQLLPGKPDFVFHRERLVVFVDGCFWHGCPWHCRMPKSRQSYWQPKIAGNRSRDKAILKLLETTGWRVYRIWEHSLNEPRTVVEKLTSRLQNAEKHTKGAS